MTDELRRIPLNPPQLHDEFKDPHLPTPGHDKSSKCSWKETLNPLGERFNPSHTLEPNFSSQRNRSNSSFFKPPTLGYFQGVTLPTCEFMWSVLIFVRFSWILSQTGFLIGLSSLILCASLILGTTTSISAIATNGLPRDGVVPVLARVLGAGMGGVIGFIFGIGVTMFAAVEVTGSTEGFLQIHPLHWVHPDWDQRLLAWGCFIILFWVAYLGHQAIHRLSIVFLIALTLAYASVFLGFILAPKTLEISNPLHLKGIGWSWNTFSENLWPVPQLSLQNTLSLLFPCFLGIYTGVNNASALKNPYEAIPRGTILAITMSLILYSTFFFCLAATIPRSYLLHYYTITAELAWPHKTLASIGIFLVGNGSALHCINLSAQVFSSLIREKVLPRPSWFPPLESLSYSIWNLGLKKINSSNNSPSPNSGRSRSSSGEPRIALMVCVVFAMLIVFFNDLEELASVVTLCFLLCYALTNLSCSILSWLALQTWRPHFRGFHWTISFLSFLGCLSLMFFIKPMVAFLFLVVTLIGTHQIQRYHSRSMGSSMSWGHAMQGVLYALTLRHLTALEQVRTMRTITQLCNELEDMDLMFNPASAHFVPQSMQSNFPLHHMMKQWMHPETSSRLSSSHLAPMWNPQIIAFFAIPQDQIQYPEVISLIAQLSTLGGLCVLAHVIVTPIEAPPGEPLSIDEGRRSTLSEPSDTSTLIPPDPLHPDPTKPQGKPDPDTKDDDEETDWETDEEDQSRSFLPIPPSPKYLSPLHPHDPSSSIELDALILKRTLILRRAAAQEKELATFVKVFSCPSLPLAQSILLQTVGLGEITANTLVTAWPERGSNWEENLKSIRDLSHLCQVARTCNQNIIIVKGCSLFPSSSSLPFPPGSFMDIWWIVNEGPLMLLIAYILKQHPIWHACTLRLFAVAREGEDPEPMEFAIRTYLLFLRIEVDEIEIVPVHVSPQDQDIENVESALNSELNQELVSNPDGLNASSQMGIDPRLNSPSRPSPLPDSVQDGSPLSLNTSSYGHAHQRWHTTGELDTGPRKRVGSFVSSFLNRQERLAEASIEIQEYLDVDGTAPTTIPETMDETLLPGLPVPPIMSSYVPSNQGSSHPTSSSFRPVHGDPSSSATPLPSFFRRATAAALRSAIQQRSQASVLLLLNLPSWLQMNQQTNLFGLDAPRRAGALMELLEFLTADLQRTLLVHCHEATRAQMKVGVDLV